jgi:CheY-like chemotaxis protein
VGGKIDLRRERIDVAEVVGKAIETAQPLIDQRAHGLRVDVRPNELFVDADSVRLAQVIGNLIVNAAKYTAPGGAIEVVATREGQEVAIGVSDNGPGIDGQLLPRIFDLFVQGTRPIDRTEGGLGLGLTLVKNLVGLHGGSVSAQNRPTGGSRFVIRLPAAEPGAAPSSNRGTGDRPITASGAPRKVLVVDDNQDAAEMIADLLRGFGHQVHVAHDGPQALEALGAFPAEVALLDLGLPVMDGLELARRIRARGGPTPRLIALTGYGQPDDRQRTAEAGFNLHLTKPIMIDDLLRALG